MLNIVTWNINGIRSSKQNLKELLDSFEADIICFQETKITRDMLDEPTALVDGYTSYYSFSRKRSGYSGVATYCKDSVTPVKAEDGLTKTYNTSPDNVGFYDHLHSAFTDDDLKKLDMEGRCIMTQHNVKSADGCNFSSFVLLNLYCPHADNDERLQFKLQFYKALELRCRDLRDGGLEIIIVGDINTSHRLIDHCEPEDMDNFSKTPSRLWLDNFLTESNEEDKFVDSFRYLYPTKEKSFTCWNTKLNARVNNYGTRIDYIFLSSKLVPRLKNCLILSEVQGSDHCPVQGVLELDIIPSLKCPSVCTKFYKEFSGTQQKMLKYVCKRTHSEIVELAKSEENESKKAKTCKSNQQQQSTLLRFFAQSSSTSKKTTSTTTSEEMSTMEGTFNKPSSSTSSTSAQLWRNVFKAPPPTPVCKGHLEPCILRTVKKKGPNMNKQFWACARATGLSTDPQARCDYFLWASANR